MLSSWHHGIIVSSIALIRERVNRDLPLDVYDVWLDLEAPPEALTGRSRPYPSEVMEATPVATAVNGPGNDEPAPMGPI